MVNPLEQLKDVALKTSPLIGFTPTVYNLSKKGRPSKEISGEALLWHIEAFRADLPGHENDMESFLKSTVRYAGPDQSGKIVYNNHPVMVNGTAYDPFGTLFLPVVATSSGKSWQKRCVLKGFKDEERLQFLRNLFDVVSQQISLEFAVASDSYIADSVSPYFCAFRKAGTQSGATSVSSESVVSTAYSQLLK